MKLKKIASLALAGIMAVSMLAGCKDGGNSNSSSSSENTNTATGYSAMLAEELKDTAAKKYVTFADSNSDKTALEDLLGNFTNSDIINTGISAGSGKAVNNAALGAYVDDLEDAAGLDGYVTSFTFAANNKMLGTWKIGTLYAANGSVDIEKVMKNIAGFIDDDKLSAQLVDKGVGTSFEVKYSYVVSASVVNVKDTTNLDLNQSTNYVLVTITRTGVAE